MDRIRKLPTRNCAERAHRFTGRLASDESGLSAIAFAVSLAVLAPLTLGLFDVYMASQQRGRLQDAMDAAALYAARSTAQTDADIDALGDKALLANLTLVEGAVLESSDFHLAGTKVVGQAQVRVHGFAPQLWQHRPVSVAAEVQRSIDRLEIALVLDNTGSMAGTKLTTLKTEAKKLVDKLATAAALSSEPTPIKIALVPFSNTVRVQATTSLSTYNTSSHTGTGIPSWVDPQGKAHWAGGTNRDVFDTQYTDRLTAMKNIGQSWSGCVEARRAPYDVQEDAPDSSTPATMFTPYFWPDEPDSSDFNDYLTDNAGSGATWMTREKRAAKYAVGASWRHTGNFQVLGMNYVHGPNAGCTLEPMMRLTTSTANVKSAIDRMVAIGETNIPVGLAWGWHALTPNAPLADGAAYTTPHLRKIVILMTDGENTLYDSGDSNDSYYGGYGFIWQNMLGIAGSASSSTRTTTVNNRLSQLCANMKAKKIAIYTVRVEVSSGSSSLLRNCATSPDMFFDVSNVSGLGAAFDSIAASITNLRITH